jgi:hypothetical protein
MEKLAIDQHIKRSIYMYIRVLKVILFYQYLTNIFDVDKSISTTPD